MTILLDTHYVYVLAGAPGRLTKAEEQFLASYSLPFSVSAVSIWEMRLKWSMIFRSGQRKGPVSAGHALEALSRQNIKWMPLSSWHAATLLTTPMEHKDPFDELLLAQAQSEGLKLLTRDRLLKKHPFTMSV